MLIKRIETNLESFQIFTLFKDKPYSFFLESAMDHQKLGRYSFIGFSPFLVFKSKGDRIEVHEDGKASSFQGNPLQAIKQVLRDYKMEYRTDLPFVGGAVGYLGYELGYDIEKISRSTKDDVNIPDCFLGLYDGVIIVDHKMRDVYIAALGIKALAEDIIADIEKHIIQGEKEGIEIGIPAPRQSSEFIFNIKKEDYLNKIHKIQAYIEAGEIYQANLTHRFECTTEASAYEIYAKLREINPAPFGGLIDFGSGATASSSPERFIRIKDRMIETRPIKGTCPRGNTPEEDRQNREELLASEKNKAELLMIVDLERNDIGKISKIGTVKVTELFHLETYPTVHHLVATITGEIRDECDVVDCLEATFPGGSITGAPKIRAMEIIDELEPTSRNVYTGSIGYIGFNGDADLNIAIRTILYTKGKAYFQVGGGITWGSEAQLEYQETLDKARALIAALKG